MQKIDASNLELTEKVVSIGPVSKTVKGGRIRRFRALVVVGDQKGHVGIGVGKAREVQEAIKKGKDDAIKNIVKIPMVGKVGSLNASVAASILLYEVLRQRRNS